MESLPIFYSQRDNFFYSAWAFALPQTLLRVPYSALESFLWTVIVYWSVNMAPTAGRFFTFWLLMFLAHQVSCLTPSCLAREPLSVTPVSGISVLSGFRRTSQLTQHGDLALLDYSVGRYCQARVMPATTTPVLCCCLTHQARLCPLAFISDMQNPLCRLLFGPARLCTCLCLSAMTVLCEALMLKGQSLDEIFRNWENGTCFDCLALLCRWLYAYFA